MNKIESVAIVGAGTMGNGIAHVFALHQFRTVLVDISQDQLNRAHQTITKNLERQLAKELISEEQKSSALQHLSITTELSDEVSSADLIIEAATENLKVKREIFRKLDKVSSPQAILATNTSSISITALAAETDRPSQVIGMHFMNPVPVMKLVEIINGYSTDVDVTQLIKQTAEQLNKTPLVVNDYPGFVSNRILMPMINEAIYTLHEGVAGVAEIDQIMQLGMAHPMGPLKLADFIGLDVCLSIMRVLHRGFGNSKYAPCPLLVNMVAAKMLGIKSGEGFYDYQKGPKSSKISGQFT